MNDVEIQVPANAVFHPLSSDYRRLFRTNTSGLASGNVIEEAIFHGLARSSRETPGPGRNDAQQWGRS